MDKNIVITGGTSGIGYTIYKSLSNPDNGNNKIVIISRHCSRKKSLFPKNTLLIDADISRKKDVKNAADRAMDYLGNIDILINNAGISFPGSFIKATKDEIERSISVNLLGLLFITHSFLPHFLNNYEGIIVNITSAAAETGIPGLSVYCASKFGLRGFSEALRKEKAENSIRLIEIQIRHSSLKMIGTYI